MKICICGPMTGHPHFNFPKFDEVERQLKRLGHEVVNPTVIGKASTHRAYKDILRDDLKRMLECDAIYLLRGWETSFGARIEYAVARSIGMAIIKE